MRNSNYYKYPFLNTALSVKRRVDDLVSRLSVNEKIGLLPWKQQAIPRLGIAACHFGTEIARGYISREAGEISTVFPQPIGLAATFNPELMYQLGEIAGTETRIYHKKSDFVKLMVWGPTVDLCRDPRWGRNEEGYGEDPYLTGSMSAAYTKGMSGTHKKYLRVLTGLKHFCCNNHEEDRNRDSANIDERLLREYYYAAFEPAIREKGAHSLMTAYNELSGVPAMINHDVRKVCKKEWGLLFSVTDGADFSQNVNAHKYSDSHAETLSLALKAGNNIMTDCDVTVIAAAKEALKQRLIREEDIDAAVAEVLTGRFMLGEFDPPELNPYNDIPDEKLNCDEFKAVNARAARECVTLLKNEGSPPVLPIKDDGKVKIAVVGLLGENRFKDWYTGMFDYNTTIAGGLRKALGENRVNFHDGCDIVAIKSLLNDKYLQVNGDGTVTAESDQINAYCRFKVMDWGSEKVYVSEINGKLLRLKEADKGGIDPNAPIGYVNAEGDDTYEWFGRMIFRADVCGGKNVYKSWRGNYLSVDENGRLCEMTGASVTPPKQFAETVVVDGVKEAVKLAKAADIAVICCGNDPMVTARECFDRKTLALPPKQQLLIDSVHKANKNAVLTITSSYPYSINKEKENIPAIVYTAHGGPESGDAMADVLLGKHNPAGRTPQTWYKSELDLPSIKDYDIAEAGSTYLYFGGEELYPFGHGLSYSAFEYSDFSVNDNALGEIEVKLKVKNTSDVFGEEVVQIYFTALNPRVKRPVKQLCEFVKFSVNAGETADISLNFDMSRLRFWDVTRQKFTVESGAYKFYAASSSKDVRCSATVQLVGDKIPPRNMRKLTPAVCFDGKRGVTVNYDKKRERHYVHAPMWSGALDFYDVAMQDVSGVEVSASIAVDEGSIGVFVNDKEVGKIDIPASACPTDFRKRKCKFSALINQRGGKLTLKLSQYVNLSDVKLV